MAFILPELDYSFDALEPYIDAETMEIHYSKHHAKYLKKFNEAIDGTPIENKTPTEIFSTVSAYDTAVRNNGGGFFNHALFWEMLTPEKKELTDVPLTDAITKYFGSVDEMKKQFSNAAANQFGSGWAWLVKKNTGELIVTSTPNQDNTLMDIAPIKGKPILCLDVWEHAYYLKYRNKRPDYIEAFWNIVNWDKVVELYNQ